MKHFNHDSQIRGRRLVSWLVATFAFLGLFGSLTINLVPATIYQSSAPIETPDTDPKPMYSPSKDYHWPTKQIPYKIKKTTSRHYVKVWQKAVQAWNNVGVVSLVATNETARAEIVLGTRTNYRDEPDGWDAEPGVVMGYTVQRVQTGNGPPLFADHNESYLITGAMTRMKYTSINQQASVAMHELGHDLWLNHSQNNHSIMQAAAPTLYSSIPQVDANHLAQLYAGVPKK